MSRCPSCNRDLPADSFSSDRSKSWAAARFAANAIGGGRSSLLDTVFQAFCSCSRFAFGGCSECGAQLGSRRVGVFAPLQGCAVSPASPGGRRGEGTAEGGAASGKCAANRGSVRSREGHDRQGSARQPRPRRHGHGSSPITSSPSTPSVGPGGSRAAYGSGAVLTSRSRQPTSPREPQRANTRDAGISQNRRFCQERRRANSPKGKSERCPGLERRGPTRCGTLRGALTTSATAATKGKNGDGVDPAGSTYPLARSVVPTG